MGCGCNKRRKRMQSSRMPTGIPMQPDKLKKIQGINVPENMNPDQRRSTIAKINNGKINKRKQKNISECVRDRKSKEG